MYVWESGVSHRSATPGVMLKWSSLRTSESKISSSMRSDCASFPIRGSRFAGADSISTTSVFVSGRCAQEVRLENTKTINHREHREAQQNFNRIKTPLCVPPCPLWLDIGNFPQHHRLPCACG